jgi:hypothetical protein
MGIVAKRLRMSAKGQDCTLQLPNVCNHDSTTTVLAHLPSPVAGMATKGDDWHAVFACSSCHAHMDTRQRPALESYQLKALQRTQKIWFNDGLLLVASDAAVRRTEAGKSLPPRKMFE